MLLKLDAMFDRVAAHLPAIRWAADAGVVRPGQRTMLVDVRADRIVHCKSHPVDDLPAIVLAKESDGAVLGNFDRIQVAMKQHVLIVSRCLAGRFRHIADREHALREACRKRRIFQFGYTNRGDLRKQRCRAAEWIADEDRRRSMRELHRDALGDGSLQSGLLRRQGTAGRRGRGEEENEKSHGGSDVSVPKVAW
jgi:hypothetical protein